MGAGGEVGEGGDVSGQGDGLYGEFHLQMSIFLVMIQLLFQETSHLSVWPSHRKGGG